MTGLVRARERRSRVTRTIFFSDVSLDGLAERSNRHLDEMILQDVLYRLCHSNQCCAPRKANSYPRVFSKNTFVFFAGHKIPAGFRYLS